MILKLLKQEFFHKCIANASDFRWLKFEIIYYQASEFYFMHFKNKKQPLLYAQVVIKVDYKFIWRLGAEKQIFLKIQFFL